MFGMWVRSRLRRPKNPRNPDVELVGISEPDAALRQKYASLFHLPDNLFFSSESAMLAKTHPQAVLV